MSRPSFSPPGSPPYCRHRRAEIDDARVAVARRGRHAIFLPKPPTKVAGLRLPEARNCRCASTYLICAGECGTDQNTSDPGGGQ
jgi:hypothetical protein